jgi:hypothetical protein
MIVSPHMGFARIDPEQDQGYKGSLWDEHLRLLGLLSAEVSPPALPNLA